VLNKFIFLSIVFSILSSMSAHAVPIDWNGSFMTDFIRIEDYARNTNGAYTGASDFGSQQVLNDGSQTAIFHSYVLKLNPHIIINDGVSLKGQLTTGSGMGGFLGNNSSNNYGSTVNGMLYNSTPNGDDTLSLAQFYAELYSDAGLYRVGRFTKAWGMGAVLNAGTGASDRFVTLYDGIDLDYKLGKFHFVPYFAKISSNNALNRTAVVQETGVSAMYDNPDQDMKAGILYTKRDVGSNSGLTARDENWDATNTNQTNETHNLNGANIKLIDVYGEKSWGKLSLKFEVPIFSGTAGNIYSSSEVSSFAGKAYLADISYQASVRWKWGLLFGHASGDDGESGGFEAMYLNPNFKIAELMYRYNMDAVSGKIGDNNQAESVFDSSVTNTTFIRVYSQYKNENVGWNFAFITATADQVAQAGRRFYNHERGHRVGTLQSTENQSDDLGYEFDVSFDYLWNPNVTISGFLGYHFVGDYYKFNNSTTSELAVEDTYTSGFRMAVHF
jgi:hypothetical protein